MPTRENQTIIFNIFLHGPPDSGRRTILDYLMTNSNILDANFIKAMQHNHKQLSGQINNYMRRIKDLPRLLKKNLNDFIETENETKLDEAKTYYEVSSYQIRELIKSYDEEISRCINKSIHTLQNAKPQTQAGDLDYFSYGDIVGSSPNIVYRIHYLNQPSLDPIHFDAFLSKIDGLIFVWDAQVERFEENTRILEELLDNLSLNKEYPLVIALNKTDLPQIINSQDLLRLLTQVQFEEKLQTTLFNETLYSGLTIFETVGSTGLNLKNLLRICVRMITGRNRAQIQEFQNIILQEVRV